MDLNGRGSGVGGVVGDSAGIGAQLDVDETIHSPVGAPRVANHPVPLRHIHSGDLHAVVHLNTIKL